ncbi:MAG: RnfABCDGE type electron transport complex subunit D [Lachnospiraceae bacterium]|jgi:electron transport complex protein RnfD|nr:RnfABCDGE type electron transport complex subunit D [Lachnospiraceae bacterium]
MAEQHINPNLRTPNTTQKIMLDVCIALVPALIYSTVIFGMNSLILTAVSVITCMAAEGIWQTLRKEALTVTDLSAAVTGMLIAFNMSSTTPVWVVVCADIFAIIVVKQVFGGIGSNVVNPALMGRLFAMVVYGGYIMSYAAPGAVDTTASATVLSAVKYGMEMNYSVVDMIIGNIPGALGETSALLLLVGFAYLAYKKEVNVLAAVVYIVAVGLGSGLLMGNLGAAFFGGGLFLGGLFMLTDYVFVTKKGKILYALAAAVITILVRQFSTYPEGVCFGILIANCTVYFLDMIDKKPHVYGVK